MIDHQKLKEARVEAGFKLRSMAREVGVSHEAIRRFENGMIDPSADVLRKICEVLHLDANEILMVKGE